MNRYTSERFSVEETIACKRGSKGLWDKLGMPASLYAKRECRHGVLETIRHIFGYFI